MSQEARAGFADIQGWTQDDHAAAWRVFHTSCTAIMRKTPSVRIARDVDAALRAVCAKAIKQSATLDEHQACAFFEAHFEPVRLGGGKRGFMTGYYEPEFAGARIRSARFSVPVYKKPNDLVNFSTPEKAPPELRGFAAARRTSDGTLVPYFSRTQIENGALQNKGLEMFWMEDAFELFTVQVQGSGRLRLEGGEVVRLTYDGRNGHPYTSVGKKLIERGVLTKEQVSMPRIGEVFKADPALAKDVMRENTSYVFFRERKDSDAARGPIGAQGLALTPFRSIAVDRTRYAYGLPFFVSGPLPNTADIAALTIAQDTGSAINGEARIDLFTGWGREAAALAGHLQSTVDLYLLRPKPDLEKSDPE